MDRDVIVKRIAELEGELASIKSAVVPPQRLAWLRGIASFLLSYWVLLSFLVAIGTVAYVQFGIGVDYFEQYRNQAVQKEISELHRKLGDRLIARAAWEEAANAYKEALKINPNNVAASVGLVEAQIFLPSGQQKFVVPEVLDVKLQYLKALPGLKVLAGLKERRDDTYILYFLEGVRYYDRGNYAAARASLQKSIEANAAFSGGYIFLGYVEQRLSNLEGAIENFRKGLELDPEDPDALNNLGYTYLLAGRYDEAVDHFRRSDSISPRMLSGINLGDACRQRGDHEWATQVHKLVLKNAKAPYPDHDRYLGGEWLYNFLPLKDGDTQTIRNFVVTRTQDQKLAIAHFALALDYAVGGGIADADGEFGEAVRLENGNEYRAFYVNRIAALERLPKLRDSAKEWLAKHRATLSAYADSRR